MVFSGTFVSFMCSVVVVFIVFGECSCIGDKVRVCRFSLTLCLCFGDGVGVGSMNDGTGSAHRLLGVLSWSRLRFSQSRRKSALLCLAGMKSVVTEVSQDLCSLSVVGASLLLLLKTSAAATSQVGTVIAVAVVTVELLMVVVVVVLDLKNLSLREYSSAFAVSLV